MRRGTETEALHGPWPDEAELARLREDHPGWRIWRALGEDLAAGDWCAQHTDTGTRLDAPTPEQLREALGEAT